MLQKKDGIIFDNFILEPEATILTEKETEDFELECKRTQLISLRKNYLSKTDWYIAREADQPSSYPEEIKNKRTLARQQINQIEVCKTSEELQQFSELEI